MRLLAVSLRSRLAAMACLIRILSVEQDGRDGLIVTFSDGTMGAYVAEELPKLRPNRELADKPGGKTALPGRLPSR
jgi:hypothetical protein